MLTLCGDCIKVPPLDAYESLFGVHAEFMTHVEHLLEMAIENLPDTTDSDRARALLRALGRQIREIDEGVGEIAGCAEAAVLRLDNGKFQRSTEVAHG